MTLKRIGFQHSHHLELDTKEWHHKDGFNLGAQAQLEDDIKAHNAVIREIFRDIEAKMIRGKNDYGYRCIMDSNLEELKQKYLEGE